MEDEKYKPEGVSHITREEVDKHKALEELISCILIKKRATEEYSPKNILQIGDKAHDILFIEKLSCFAIGLQGKDLTKNQQKYYNEIEERIDMAMCGFMPYSFYATYNDSKENTEFRVALRKVKAVYKVSGVAIEDLIKDKNHLLPSPTKHKGTTLSVALKMGR